MSRIVGLMHRDGRPAGSGILQGLIAPMRPQGSDGPRFWVSGCAGLAYQCLQTSADFDAFQPASGPASVAVCFDGRLDNRDELIHTLGDELRADPASLPDSALVLACYRRFGEAFATHLNGDFAITLFDGQRRQLVLARDVMGVRPLYYWSSGTTVIAASEIKAILAHPQVEARPDDTALADLVVGGDPNELRLTCFREVLRVMPGYTVVATPERIREFRHWDFDPTRQIRYSSVAEYAEVLRGLFEQAVRRRLRTSRAVAVEVSGGLDSSAILCQAEILRQAGEPVARALGISRVFPDGSPADEKRYLTDIETRYGLDIRRLLCTSIQYVPDENVFWHSESPTMCWNVELECLTAARELGCSVTLSGEYGDAVMFSSGRLFELALSFRWLQLRREMRGLVESMTDCSPRGLWNDLGRMFIRHLVSDGLMRPFRSIRRFVGADSAPRWYTPAFRSKAFQRAYQQQRIGGPFASVHAERCYSYFRAAHVLNALEEMNKLAAMHGLDSAHPFVDRDLVAYVMAIPGEVVNYQGIYKGLYREAMREILPESIRRRYWKADFTLLGSNAAASASASFKHEWQSECLAVKYGYIDLAALQDTLPQHRAKLTGERMLPDMQLNYLIGLELWLKTFFPHGFSLRKPVVACARCERT